MAYTYQNFLELAEHKTWAEIDLDALRHNYRLLCETVCQENCRPICVVKADAYGHGTVPCVRALYDEGCDFFAVSSIEEAIAVRKALCALDVSRRAEILILGYTLPLHAPLLIEHGIIQTVFSADYAAELAAAVGEGSIRIHVKLDTGMNRLGFSTVDSDLDSTVSAISAIAENPHFHLCGIFTHYARADETDEKPIDAPHERYAEVCRLLHERGIECGMRHTCNSAAAVRFSVGRYDAVRLGIMLYGASASEPVSQHYPLDLRPVMRLCTTVAHVHGLPVGESVSYGGNWSADTPRQLATLPVGYADGFLRAYTGCSVLLTTESGLHECPVVGNICMDQCVIDATGTDVKRGDTVILFGDKPERIEALSARAQTISYESFTLISGRVARIYRGKSV